MGKRIKKQRTNYLKHTKISLERLIDDYYAIGYIYKAQGLEKDLKDMEDEFGELMKTNNDTFLDKLRQIVAEMSDLMGKCDYKRELYAASSIIADLIEDIEKRLELEKKLLKGGVKWI